MIEFFVVSLLQAAAGMPDAPPAPAATEPAGVSAPAEAGAPTEPAAEPAPAAEAAPAPVQMRRERVCHEMEISGRRIPQRVCRTVMVPVEPEQPAQATTPEQD